MVNKYMYMQLHVYDFDVEGYYKVLFCLFQRWTALHVPQHYCFNQYLLTDW